MAVFCDARDGFLPCDLRPFGMRKAADLTPCVSKQSDKGLIVCNYGKNNLTLHAK